MALKSYKDTFTTVRPDIRLWTATVLIGLCGFSLVQGLNIVRFSLAMANVKSLEKRAEIINTWASAPNVASEALQAALGQKANVSDPETAHSRREVLLSILSIEPLSSVNWLWLSQLQLVTDQPMELVFDSLELSMLTGPNEGYLRAERGTYGVSLWGRLSPELQRRVALDLAGREVGLNEKFRAVLSAQPERARKELGAAMLATGLSPQEIEKRLAF
jgi:hypothetical protein